MEYRDAVFLRIIYWVCLALNRLALQYIKAFFSLSDGRASEGVTPIFLANLSNPKDHYGALIIIIMH